MAHANDTNSFHILLRRIKTWYTIEKTWGYIFTKIFLVLAWDVVAVFFSNRVRFLMKRCSVIFYSKYKSSFGQLLLKQSPGEMALPPQHSPRCTTAARDGGSSQAVGHFPSLLTHSCNWHRGTAFIFFSFPLLYLLRRPYAFKMNLPSTYISIKKT